MLCSLENDFHNKIILQKAFFTDIIPNNSLIPTIKTEKVISMNMTLYFAKLNLISDDIFRLYDDPKQKDSISYALYEAIESHQQWKKENVFFDDNGEAHTTVIEYSAHILRTDNTNSYLEGWLYKKSKLYYKTLDDSTDTLVQRSTENIEGNRFTLDINHGLVGYNTSARFGYKEFIEAFVNTVNLGEAAQKYDYRYNMSLCVSGISLENIKKELTSIGRIRELKIRMQPPNPSEDLLDDLQKRCDGLVKDFRDANVTELELFYSTKGSSGIDLSAPLVREKNNDIQGLYSGLAVEDSTKKGYVSVEATSTRGRKYSSGESKPIKRVIDGIESFFDSCIDAFQQLL